MKHKYEKPIARNLDALPNAQGECFNGTVAKSDTGATCGNGLTATGSFCVSGSFAQGTGCYAGGDPAGDGCNTGFQAGLPGGCHIGNLYH